MSTKVYWKFALLAVFFFTALAGAVSVSAGEPAAIDTDGAALAPAQAVSSSACSPVVTGNRVGVNSAPHTLAFDGSTSTFFESTYNNWQFIQVDFNCVGIFDGLRRYMTRDGDDASGNRWIQGEGVSYSVDGVNWTSVTAVTSDGWQIYTNYAPHAWHSVEYGWSNWLNLKTPVQARYIRFNWDGNSDAVNEIEINFEQFPPLDVNLHCDAGGGSFLCDGFSSGGSGGNSYSWQITAGNATITRVVGSASGSVSTAIGTCQIGQTFGIEVTVQDSSGQVAKDRLSGVKCYTFMP